MSEWDIGYNIPLMKKKKELHESHVKKKLREMVKKELKRLTEVQV